MAHVGHGALIHGAWYIEGVVHIGRGTYGGKGSLTHEASLAKIYIFNTSKKHEGTRARGHVKITRARGHEGT